MPRTARRATALTLSATLLVGLSACGDDAPPEPPATVTVTQEPTQEALDKPEQQEVDEATAKKALPTLKDMPEGPWGRNVTKLSSKKSTYEPAVCAAVELDDEQARTFRDEHRSARAEAKYTAFIQGENHHISTYLESFDEPVPAAILDAAGQHVTECADYSETTTTPIETGAKPITTEQIGDQTFGVRITVKSSGAHVDRLYVRSGHNLITVMTLSREREYDGALMTKYARHILDGLKKKS